MMNEIILNGVSSTELTGLIIQTLPPIVKPAIRNQKEEIDGQDGDLITKLGYAAYDKSFNIGLSYNYDIDEIIAFFNSEGTVIFSNEDDKYYNYQILEQIDFERLIRFKTATVNMHVQPFKYSTVETTKIFNINNQLLNLNDYTSTLNGITLTASRSNNLITISGTGTGATEFYVPINSVSLSPGNYTLNAYSSGTNPQACGIRLIYDSPSAANSFGGTYVMLQNSNTVSITSNLTETKTYNYMYFYISAGTAMNFTLDLLLENNADQSITIRNNGNYISRPVMTLYGSGTINLSLNNAQIFVINLGNEGYITIDADSMNAYKDGVLKNRLVAGNYDNFCLNIGVNIISFTGEVTQIYIYDYSRWI